MGGVQGGHEWEGFKRGQSCFKQGGGPQRKRAWGLVKKQGKEDGDSGSGGRKTQGWGSSTCKRLATLLLHTACSFAEQCSDEVGRQVCLQTIRSLHTHNMKRSQVPWAVLIPTALTVLPSALRQRPHTGFDGEAIHMSAVFQQPSAQLMRDTVHTTQPAAQSLNDVQPKQPCG